MRLLMFEHAQGAEVVVNPERVLWLTGVEGSPGLTQIFFSGHETVMVVGNLAEVANRLGRLTQ